MRNKNYHNCCLSGLPTVFVNIHKLVLSWFMHKAPHLYHFPCTCDYFLSSDIYPAPRDQLLLSTKLPRLELNSYDTQIDRNWMCHLKTIVVFPFDIFLLFEQISRKIYGKQVHLANAVLRTTVKRASMFEMDI